VKYLITGGAGFIGSHLAESLLSKGDSVVIIDNLSTGSQKNLRKLSNKVTIFQDDILNRSLVNKLVSDVDFVVHLAAALGVFNIVNKPLDSLKTNLQGTEIILEAADNYNKPVLIASSRRGKSRR